MLGVNKGFSELGTVAGA